MIIMMKIVSMSTHNYFVYTDGGKRHGVTYGSYKVFDSAGRIVLQDSVVFGHGTSNLAEYLTLISALHWTYLEGIKNIVIYTDSNLMVNQIKNRWQCNYEHLIEAKKEVLEILELFDTWDIVYTERNFIFNILGH